MILKNVLDSLSKIKNLVMINMMNLVLNNVGKDLIIFSQWQESAYSAALLKNKKIVNVYIKMI